MTAKKNTKKKETKKEETKTAPKKNFNYYLLKVKTYVAEGVRWEAGLYKVDGEIPRLEGQKKIYVEKFEGEVPDNVVFKLAEQFNVKINDEKGKMRKPEEILDQLSIDRDIPQDKLNASKLIK